MSDERKDLFEEEESYEDIFKNLREKYHLNDDYDEEDDAFYDPEEDSELEEFFTERNQVASDRADEFMDVDDNYEEESVDNAETAEEVSAPIVHSASDYVWDDNIVLTFETKDDKKKSDIPITFEDISSNAPQNGKEEIGISLEKIKNEQSIKADDGPGEAVNAVNVQPIDYDTTENINQEEFNDETLENSADEYSGNPEGYLPPVNDISPSEYPESEDNAEFDFVEEDDNSHKENTPYQISPEYFDDDAIEPVAKPMKDVTYESIVWEDFPDKKDKRKNKKKNKKKKHGIFPRKGDSAGEVIRKLILIIAVITIILSGAWLVNDIVIQPYLASRLNAELGDTLLDSKTNKVVKNFDNLNDEDKKLTMEKLRARNNEYMGWLTVSGADVSLPVVKTADNDKYLHRDFDGNYLAAGTLFVDARNNSLYDNNVIIYGHNMSNGSMFGQLRKYKHDSSVYNTDPLIYFHTINGDFVYKIFGVYAADGDAVADNGFIANALVTNYTPDAFVGYMEQVAHKRFFDTSVDYQKGDSILTLITCDRTEMDNGRLIVVARLVRSGESY